MSKTKQKKLLLALFYLGLIIFALGIVAFFVNYPVPSPAINFQVGLVNWSMPFFNWVTIAGIVFLIVGFLGNLAVKSKKEA